MTTTTPTITPTTTAMTKPNDMSKLLHEALAIKARMTADKARLAEINATVANAAAFKEGSKTGTLAMDGVLAKVQLKETVSWSQDALQKAYSVIGADEFRKAFTYKFEPVSAKVLTSWMADPSTKDEWRALVADARTVKEGAPSVTYTDVREEGV